MNSREHIKKAQNEKWIIIKKKIEKNSKTCEAQKKRPDIRLRKKEFFKYFANQTDTFARCFEFHDY